MGLLTPIPRGASVGERRRRGTPRLQVRNSNAARALSDFRTRRAERYLQPVLRRVSIDRSMGERWGVLVVDDDELVTSLLTALLKERGHRFTCVRDVASATQALAREQFDVVMLDMYLPDGEGLTVLDRALEIEPPPVCIMMTGRAEIRAAVEAMRRGASDFLVAVHPTSESIVVREKRATLAGEVVEKIDERVAWHCCRGNARVGELVNE